jgi:transcriptional repressor NrdR
MIAGTGVIIATTWSSDLPVAVAIMKCPYCQASDTKVIDSRTSREGFSIRRRRLCVECEHRFTTYEQLGETPVTVIKKDKSRIPFDRGKIRAGLEKACYKRPISAEVVDGLAAKVEAEVIRLGESEVSSHRIGEFVMKELRELDPVAYVRFASVYRDFKDASDFEDEIRPMLAREPQ